MPLNVASLNFDPLQLMSLNDLIERFRDTLGGDDYDNASRVWNGVDMVAQLKNAGIGPDKLCTLKVSSQHMFPSRLLVQE